MQKVIKNNWHREAGRAYELARILDHRIHPEGLDIERVRFRGPGSISTGAPGGQLLSVLRGSGTLVPAGGTPLRLAAGVHCYLPPCPDGVLTAEAGTELVCVSAVSEAQARGSKLIVRDEAFLAACAAGSQLLRWVLTPQYLSRRIFLHHDPILLSRTGNPVSWFRTTMFDVAGLPLNQDGEPVFKMSYNSRTEVNVCYDVKGDARVRMALHPYRRNGQQWGPWKTLDKDSTYHLNEAAGGPEEEVIEDGANGSGFLRNRHEVSIADGHVTLFCLFDPAPVGIENHRPGEYSDYEPLSRVLGTDAYEVHCREIARFDEMVDRLSLAKAAGTLAELSGTPEWELYRQGRDAQAAIETALIQKLSNEGTGRERVVARWSQTRLPAGAPLPQAAGYRPILSKEAVPCFSRHQ